MTNKPPFKMLTGGFTWGITQDPADFWVFEAGEWGVKELPPQASAYYALTVAGRTTRPFVRLSDVQSYQEWQVMNDVEPSEDEWWHKAESGDDGTGSSE